jgi:hypothetical protein
MEEVLVVEKRLVLKREIRISKRSTSETVEIPVSLRKQRAKVEYQPPSSCLGNFFQAQKKPRAEGNAGPSGAPSMGGKKGAPGT